jgi:hypothetical protein
MYSADKFFDTGELGNILSIQGQDFKNQGIEDNRDNDLDPNGDEEDDEYELVFPMPFFKPDDKPDDDEPNCEEDLKPREELKNSQPRQMTLTSTLQVDCKSLFAIVEGKKYRLTLDPGKSIQFEIKEEAVRVAVHFRKNLFLKMDSWSEEHITQSLENAVHRGEVVARENDACAPSSGVFGKIFVMENFGKWWLYMFADQWIDGNAIFYAIPSYFELEAVKRAANNSLPS